MTDYTEKAQTICRPSHSGAVRVDDAQHVEDVEAALREANEAGRKEQAQWQLIETAPHDENVLLAYWDELTGRWHMEAGMASWG